jgi:nitrogen fixation NifU-like protein
VVVDPGGEAGPGLYQEAIVAAARRACGSGRLDTPDASVEVDNPLCGDRVGMDVQVGDGRLRGIAHRVRGCLLCEAAASIIAANAVGEPVEAVFAPVVRHRSRHRCVTLAFEALARALAAAAPGAADDG